MVDIKIKFRVMLSVFILSCISATITTAHIDWLTGYVLGGILMAALNWISHDVDFKRWSESDD